MLQLTKTNNSNELNIEIHYPLYFDPDSQITELQFLSGLKTSRGIHKVQYFENMSVIQSAVNTQEAFPLHLEYDFAVVVLEFFLSTKQLVYTSLSSDLSISYHAGQHNIVFIPQSELLHEHLACNNIEVVRIHISPDYFKRLVPDKKIFELFLKHIESGTFTMICPKSMPITPAMYGILNEIQTEERKGVYKRILLEAKVLELMMLQFEQYEELMGKDIGMFVSSAPISQYEIKKMQEVKEFLHQNMQSNYSLIYLAHIVGTNLYTLKKNFKLCFGVTVFGYLNRIRMEEARRLLLTKALSINQIADLIGYKNANHFSTAFKKHFGHIPSELKK